MEGGKKEKRKKENHNKKTTKCSANPAVNESGSLQQFFYALSIPQGDKRNAEPAPSATSPTPLHCKHCRLPHFMSVNPFKPTGEYSCQRGQKGFSGDVTHPLSATLGVLQSMSVCLQQVKVQKTKINNDILDMDMDGTQCLVKFPSRLPENPQMKMLIGTCSVWCMKIRQSVALVL